MVREASIASRRPLELQSDSHARATESSGERLTRAMASIFMQIDSNSILYGVALAGRSLHPVCRGIAWAMGPGLDVVARARRRRSRQRSSRQINSPRLEFEKTDGRNDRPFLPLPIPKDKEEGSNNDR